MEKEKKRNRYEKVVEEARLSYASIGKVWCPILDDEIFFNSAGFKHLIRKGKELRFQGEQKRRFALIGEIEGILKNAKQFTERVLRSGDKKVVFWTFSEEREVKTIKVVVRQIEGQRKKFLSVFERNKKSTPRE